ncbi:hypothetical protein D3C85_1164160 [compost metagenome]
MPFVVAPRQFRGQAQPREWGPEFVRDVVQQLLARVDQGLQTDRHGVEIPRQQAQLVLASGQLGRRVGFQVSGGQRMGGVAQLRQGRGDVARQGPAEGRRHRQREQQQGQRHGRQRQYFPV